jgi:hypothetical protein
MVPIPNTDVALGQLISEFLASDSRRLCIFAHPLADSSDGWISSSRLRLATFGNDVYVLIASSDVTDADKSANSIRSAKSLWWSAVLVSTPVGLEEAGDRVELTEESLREIAARAEHILVEAYDQEGFLAWSKPPRAALGK